MYLKRGCSSSTTCIDSMRRHNENQRRKNSNMWKPCTVSAAIPTAWRRHPRAKWPRHTGSSEQLHCDPSTPRLSSATTTKKISMEKRCADEKQTWAGACQPEFSWCQPVHRTMMHMTERSGSNADSDPLYQMTGWSTFALSLSCQSPRVSSWPSGVCLFEAEEYPSVVVRSNGPPQTHQEHMAIFEHSTPRLSSCSSQNSLQL